MDIRELDKLYYYEEDDLGLTIKDENFIFKFWSPLAERAYLCIYDHYESQNFKEYGMNKAKGIFSISLNEDIKEKFYTFVVYIDGKRREFVDPYARAVSVNGIRGAIIDMNDTNPEGFLEHKGLEKIEPCDSIICEISIRDISIDKSLNIKNKGKFLGIKQFQNCDFENLIGISHIKEMGFTHVQIMPIYDFASIDEKLASNNEVENNRPYNWGYDPQNYNAVEGSYSTNPYDAKCRIRELKETIQEIHSHGLGVIMDVVYNHLYEYDKSGFHLSMPGYFFRYNNGYIQDETGCGNTIASENKMVRKFIVDSVKFWASEYKLDGFRFDLMGLIDIDTMNEIKKELKKINPYIIIIGEGWNMNSTLPEERRAIQKNASKMNCIGFFNDTMRDALRGSEFIENDRGFLNGDSTKKLRVESSIVGGINYSDKIRLWGEVSPGQVVNYVECHDNYTFYDKLLKNGVSLEIIKDVQKLGISIIILSQGIPFMQIGQEFLRTKQGVENSYNSPDNINKVCWNMKKQNIDSVIYTKGLIELRKSFNIFRLKTAEEIKKGLKFIETKDCCIAYTLENSNDKILVVHNANEYDYYLNFDEELNLEVLIDKFNSGINVIETLKTKNIKVQKISTFVAKIIS